MRTVVIEGVEHDLDCNALTPFYYSEMFLVRRGNRMVCEDINDAIAQTFAGMSETGIPPMLKMQQLFWAFEKTAHPETTPDFKTWASKLPPTILDMTRSADWSMAITEMVTEYFFPTAARADVGAESEQEPVAVAAERA